MRVLTRLLGLSVLAGATFACASTAQAACYGSTPTSAVFADSAFDGQSGLAPEITTVQASVDASCTYAVVPGLTDSLISGDAVFVYLDRDGNSATGSPLFAGADAVVGTLGVTGLEGPPLLGVWNGVDFTFSDPSPVGGARNDGGFAASVDRLGIASGTTSQLVVATIYQGIYDNYIDMAPEPGAAGIALPVAYSTTPPPPPPPPPPPSTAPQRTQPVQGCVVPYLRGRTAASAKNRLFNADCDFANAVRRQHSRTVRKGRVIRTTPAAGTQTTRTVRIVVSKGRRKRARAAVSVTMLHRLEQLANATR